MGRRMGSRAKGKYAPLTQMQAHERKQACLRLRSQGLSYEAMGRQLGVSWHTARKWYLRAVDFSLNDRMQEEYDAMPRPSIAAVARLCGVPWDRAAQAIRVHRDRNPEGRALALACGESWHEFETRRTLELAEESERWHRDQARGDTATSTAGPAVEADWTVSVDGEVSALRGFSAGGSSE